MDCHEISYSQSGRIVAPLGLPSLFILHPGLQQGFKITRLKMLIKGALCHFWEDILIFDLQ